jgi:hypothetical protein
MGGEPLWRLLVEHVLEDPNPIMDIVAALGPWSREITPVRFLGGERDEMPIQDVPYYVDVRSWWTHGIPEAESIQRALLPSLKRLLGAAQCKRLIEQLEPNSTHMAADTVRVLNMQAPRKMLANLGLKVPAWVRLPIEQCLWNITPKKSYTDLHTDRGLDTVSFQVGGRKLWLLYEPDPPATATNKVLERQSRFFQQWAEHFNAALQTPNSLTQDSLKRTLLEIAGPNLRRPYIAVTEGHQGLFVPAGWKHAVFTLESGYLAGYSFGTHQHVEHHVNTLLGELEAAIKYQNPGQFDPRTDYLLPALWEDLHESLSYVMFHLIEISKSGIAEYNTAAGELGVGELGRKLLQFLDRVLPALRAKNGAAIKEYIKLARGRKF